jgi:predicted glycosyltransferase
MKLLFYLGHPAHFHLFKNSIKHFKNLNHEVHILIKKKDVLEDLLQAEGFEYYNIFPKTRGASKVAMAKTILKRNFLLAMYCLKHKPDLLIGTSVENTHIGKLLGIPTINVNEDDHHVVPLYSKMSYPLSQTILSPSTCSNGKWENKTVHYQGYQELSYLHPHNFTPRADIAGRYVLVGKPYFLIRFAKLNAHHDKGIHGIDKNVALRIIEKLKPYGQIFITSEKKLEKEFDEYHININPIDMHHVMAFASLYIGDSQTMAAEAGVLGTPFIRFNDFVGRIGYLNELEEKYRLGYGILPSQPEKLMATLDFLLNVNSIKEIFQDRRSTMLKDKIDVSRFMIWFIGNYPRSRSIMMQMPNYQSRFAYNKNIEKLSQKKTGIQVPLKTTEFATVNH